MHSVPVLSWEAALLRLALAALFGAAIGVEREMRERPHARPLAVDLRGEAFELVADDVGERRLQAVVDLPRRASPTLVVRRLASLSEVRRMHWSS